MQSALLKCSVTNGNPADHIFKFRRLGPIPPGSLFIDVSQTSELLADNNDSCHRRREPLLYSNNIIWFGLFHLKFWAQSSESVTIRLKWGAHAPSRASGGAPRRQNLLLLIAHQKATCPELRLSGEGARQ